MQRLLDILITLLALLAFSPIMLMLVIVLRLTGEGEVFYIQIRSGKGGSEFGLCKFATMLKNSPKMGAGEITLKNDTRVLPIGKFLRKTKLNELPQLWNILIGDMSIVGPRPMVINTYKKYPKEAREKLNRVKPGLTGIGSIVFRDEEYYLSECDDPADFYLKHIVPYKSDLEVWFVENNSIGLYMKIIVITAWVILFPRSKSFEKYFKDVPRLPEKLRKS